MQNLNVSKEKTEIKIDESLVGTRVRCLRDFSGVPKGTEGIIDEDYGSGVMVAWNLPKRPLPKTWNQFKMAMKRFARHEWPLRDGFDKKTELQFLEKIR